MLPCQWLIIHEPDETDVLIHRGFDGKRLLIVVGAGETEVCSFGVDAGAEQNVA